MLQIFRIRINKNQRRVTDTRDRTQKEALLLLNIKTCDNVADATKFYTKQIQCRK